MGQHFSSRVSSKGQITLPAEVRRKLAIRPKDRVDIQMEDDVVTVSRGSGLEQAWSRVPSGARARTALRWKDIEETAHDEHAQDVALEGLE